MKQLLCITLLFSLTVFFTASSCKKPKSDEPQLPPETQMGANTVGFKINGKLYTARGKSGLFSSQYVWANGPYSTDTSIILRAHNSVEKFDLRIVIKFLGSIGLHYTTSYPYEGLLQLNSDGTLPNNSDIFQTTQVFQGRVNIKFTDATLIPLTGFSIIAGTFEMDAINSEGKIITLSEGRFDISQ